MSEPNPQTQEQKNQVVINMWLSKTFLRGACEEYLSQLNKSVLELAKEALSNIKEERRVYEWWHTCGEKPRYWYIKINEDGIIEFSGGRVWRAEIRGNILYSDGCIKKGMLKHVVNTGLRHLETLKCRRFTLS